MKFLLQDVSSALTVTNHHRLGVFVFITPGAFANGRNPLIPGKLQSAWGGALLKLPWKKSGSWEIKG